MTLTGDFAPTTILDAAGIDRAFDIAEGVDVTISNLGDEAKKVGIAIALYDADGRLVGVASGGSKLVAIKPDRKSTYELNFADVGNMAHRAATFQISLEAK